MNEAELNKEVEELKEVAAKSINPCLTAKFIALSDARVRSLFLTKLQDGYVFRGVNCLSGPSIPENRSVYFDFDCPAGRVCFVKPAFVAIVNIVHGYVVAIIDRYTGSTGPVASQPRAASELTAVPLAGDGTLPLANDGTLPLASDGTLPLAGGGSLPLRVLGYVLVPVGWRFGTG